ncbi:MAG TPA: NAD(P)-dependent oxidoreductase [Bacillota bacterium]|nr:NAD(P)-dependent oxidoreductase [Bacillota bacterium]
MESKPDKQGHLAVLAADRRGHAAAAELERRGVPVRVADAGSEAEIRAALLQAEAVLGPVRAPAGMLRHLEVLPHGTPLFVGLVDAALRAAAAGQGFPLRSYTDDEAFAIANAVPTAEGAIAEASRLSGETMHGAHVAVLGFGRCGRALAERLIAWHAQVTVAARRAEQLAAAQAMGARAVPWSQRAMEAQFVFNTVPAPALGSEELTRLHRGTWILDLASEPGGVDRAAAEACGLNARLLPSLPGRLFPETAGRIVAETILPWLPPVLRGGKARCDR